MSNARAKSREITDGKREDKDKGIDKDHGSILLSTLQSEAGWSQRIEFKNAKKRFAVNFGYLGSAYHGLQINPGGVLTIEAMLEKALYLAGGIRNENFGNINKIAWNRSGRTDKGVHAASQCCSMMLMVPNVDDIFGGKLSEATELTYPELANDTQALSDCKSKEQDMTFVDKVNSFLPTDVRVHSITKTMKAFNAKNHCDARLYHYLLPTYIFHNPVEVDAFLKDNASLYRPAAGGGGACIDVEAENEDVYDWKDKKSNVDLNGLGALFKKHPALSSYRISKEQLALLQEALNKYVGTHHFHNFTAAKIKLSSSDAASKRFIKSFECSAPFIDENTGCQWVTLAVHGQSFLYNQIRKMVAAAIDVVRGQATPLHIEEYLKKNTQLSSGVPVAPGVGLYLNQLDFDGYNHKIDLETKTHVNKKHGVEKPGAHMRVEKEKKLAMKEKARQEQRDAKRRKLNPEYSSWENEKEGKEGSEEKEGDVREEKEEDAKEESKDSKNGSSVVVSADENNHIVVDYVSDAQHRKLQWSCDEVISQRTQEFRETVMWRHILDEEHHNLHFLLYLNQIRIRPHKYTNL